MGTGRLPSPVWRCVRCNSITALGKESTDGEVITPAVTVGTEGGRVPLAKFKQNAGKKTALFLTDKEWQPLKDRVIPGSAEVTLIQPAKLLIDLFDSVCKAVTEGEAPAEDDPSWALFGEEYGELDNLADNSGHYGTLDNLYSDVSDLKSELIEIYLK